jgi:hypothetical protein
MTVLTEFEAGQVLAESKIFTVISGSSILPQSGSFLAAPLFLINDVVSTAKLRLRLYATPKILDAANADVLSEKARPFGGVTGSLPNSPVFNDLIVDVDADTIGTLVLNPPLLGGHAFTGSDDIYYYLQEASTVTPSPDATASVTTALEGDITTNYIQLANVTGSYLISESVTITSGEGGFSSSIITPEIFSLLSGSVTYVSGGGGSGWEYGSRLRIYQDESSMNATGEIDRPFLSPISASFQHISGPGIAAFSGSGIIIDMWFSASLSGALFPMNVGSNMNILPTSQSWFRYEPSASLPSDGDVDLHLQVVGMK